MANYFKTPIGTLVPIGGLAPTVAGAVVTWQPGVTETFATASQAQAYLAAMLVALEAATPASGFIQDLSGGALLVTALAPNPFVAASGTPTISGFGFASATLGTFRVTDPTNSFGWYYTCVFVSASQMTTSGSGAIGSGLGALSVVTMSYVDSNGNASNVVHGTYDGTNFTADF